MIEVLPCELKVNKYYYVYNSLYEKFFTPDTIDFWKKKIKMLGRVKEIKKSQNVNHTDNSIIYKYCVIFTDVIYVRDKIKTTDYYFYIFDNKNHEQKFYVCTHHPVELENKLYQKAFEIVLQEYLSIPYITYKFFN